MSDQRDLERLKKLCEEATPGPWAMVTYTGHQPPFGDWAGQIAGADDWLVYVGPFSFHAISRRADAVFIAESRQTIPALITEIEGLRNLVDYYTGKAENWVENALGVVGHRFDEDGVCIRCGTDAEDADQPCTEGILKELEQAEAIIEFLDSHRFVREANGGKLSAYARQKLIAAKHVAFVYGETVDERSHA